MNLRDLEYLVALAEHRHFGRAAEACFISQPTLSTQIRKLETELGVALIERAPRQVMLTPAGEQVVSRAQAILAEASNIRGIAHRAADPEAASIRLGLIPTIAPYLLPHVVTPLRSRLPHLELLLVEEKTEVLLDHLGDGRIDAAVLALPVPGDHLHVEPLYNEDFVLAVPADHALTQHAGPVDLHVLGEESVLLLEEGHCLREQALEVCTLAGVAERVGFRATSLETLRQMVAAGVGVTLLPELAVEPPVPLSPAIRLMHFAEPTPQREVAMAWRRTSVFGDLLSTVVDEIRTAISNR